MHIKFRMIFLLHTLILMLVISSCISSTPKVTPAPIATSTMNIETLLADPGYMAGCKAINPNLSDEQASYKGIYPGGTTSEEVERFLGKPLRTNDIHGVSWEYENYLAIAFNRTVVSEVFASGDDVTTLKDFILQYGCPDGIYALDINEHPYGEYSRLLFLYHRIGFDFAIDHIPASLNDTVYDTTYFIPGTLEDYKNIFLTFAQASKLITWDEAVR